MFRVAVLFACLALCQSHAVLPVVPAVHTAPLVVAPLHHGYAGPGLLGHGLLGHGLVAKPLGHHLWKRSPHYVAPLAHAAHGLAVAPIAHVAPVAVSHQSRVDVHSSPAVVAAPVLPVIKPVVAPVLAAPLLHKPLVAGPYYGLGGLYGGHYAGHYGGLYGHGHY